METGRNCCWSLKIFTRDGSRVETRIQSNGCLMLILTNTIESKTQKNAGFDPPWYWTKARLHLCGYCQANEQRWLCIEMIWQGVAVTRSISRDNELSKKGSSHTSLKQKKFVDPGSRSQTTAETHLVRNLEASSSNSSGEALHLITRTNKEKPYAVTRFTINFCSKPVYLGSASKDTFASLNPGWMHAASALGRKKCLKQLKAQGVFFNFNGL